MFSLSDVRGGDSQCYIILREEGLQNCYVTLYGVGRVPKKFCVIYVDGPFHKLGIRETPLRGLQTRLGWVKTTKKRRFSTNEWLDLGNQIKSNQIYLLKKKKKQQDTKAGKPSLTWAQQKGTIKQ